MCYSIFCINKSRCFLVVYAVVTVLKAVISEEGTNGTSLRL